MTERNTILEFLFNRPAEQAPHKGLFDRAAAILGRDIRGEVPTATLPGLLDIIEAQRAELSRKDAALAAAEAFIDGLRQDLFSRRFADWYPEGAHNAAEAMSEDMRLLGNACAQFDARAARMPAEGRAAIEQEGG